LRQSPFFQVYLQRLATSTAGAEALQQRFEQAEQKLDQLRDNNLEFREAVIAEARTEVETLREKLGQKDVDLARLRGQRDELNAELTERRVRDTDKMRFADEMEQLCSKREERINFLCSEVRRLKGKLAAKDGAEGYLAFLKDGPVDGDYVKALEQQLQATKDEVSGLADQLKNAAGGDATTAASETAIRTELEAARRRLAEYERILGPNASSDVKDLAARLEEQADARKKLELQLAEAEDATNALYQELEGVNKLWEELDQTLKTKVFELKDGELRMQRLSTEKAKADNKYFTAMRSKEGVEAELRAAQRTVGKQLKLIEKAKEVERSQGTQIVGRRMVAVADT
jgi:E3 ubiquitin-protein ligase BRE1